MGVAATHYVVLGVALKNKAQVKKFFGISEKFLDFTDKYNDNGYKDKPTKTDSGIHMIVDGMCGEYIVIGKILSKGVDDGLPFTQMPTELIALGEATKIMEEISKIDNVMETTFSELPLEYIAFTHWH
jgi:hypothetical protein